VRDDLSQGGVIFATNDTSTVIEHQIDLVGAPPATADVV